MGKAELLRLLQRANKLGGAGLKVVEVIEPQSSGQADYILVTEAQHPRTGSERSWWEE